MSTQDKPGTSWYGGVDPYVPYTSDDLPKRKAEEYFKPKPMVDYYDVLRNPQNYDMRHQLDAALDKSIPESKREPLKERLRQSSYLSLTEKRTLLK